MRNTKLGRAFGAVLWVLSGTGCSLSDSGDAPRLHLDLSELTHSEARSYSLLRSMGPGYGILPMPPVSIGGFKCFAVNVTGPGIADSSRNPDRDPMLEFNRTISVPGRYCSYRGIVSPPLLPGNGPSEMALQVPPGGIRLVQVVGVNSQYMCDTGIRDDEPGTDGDGAVFELGRAVLRDVFQDQSVSIVADWNTADTTEGELARAKKSMDCDDNACGYAGDTLYDAASSPNVSIDQVKKLAQKLDVAPGATIRRVDVRLNVTTAGTALVAICQTPSGSPPANNCQVTSNFNEPVSVAVGEAVVQFRMHHLTMGYLQAQAGYDYYAVVSVPTGDPPLF